MKYVTACVLLLAAAAVSNGCAREHPDDDGKRITRHIAMHDEGAITRTRQGKPALIDQDGGLSIDGTAVPLSPAQRRLAKRYHDLTAALYADGLTLASASDPAGGPDAPVGDDIIPLAAAPDASVEDRNRVARRLCGRIGELQVTERALADAVPAFKPHATLPADAGKLCKDGLDQ